MQFTVPFFLATFIGCTTAVNLRLFVSSTSCSGNGVICQGIPAETCCTDLKNLYGAAQADSATVADSVAAPWAKQGNLWCGVQLSATKPIPVCFITDLPSSVGGISWEIQAGVQSRMSRRSGDLSRCTSSVVGDEFYSDGVKSYIISQAKMATVESVRPTNEADLLEFFKTHADSVIDDATEVATVHP